MYQIIEKFAVKIIKSIICIVKVTFCLLNKLFFCYSFVYMFPKNFYRKRNIDLYMSLVNVNSWLNEFE